jgi:hypothetical protein
MQPVSLGPFEILDKPDPLYCQNCQYLQEFGMLSILFQGSCPGNLKGKEMFWELVVSHIWTFPSLQ